MARPAQDFARRPRLDDPAMADDVDMIGDSGDQSEIVADQQDACEPDIRPRALLLLLSKSIDFI